MNDSVISEDFSTPKTSVETPGFVEGQVLSDDFSVIEVCSLHKKRARCQ